MSSRDTIICLATYFNNHICQAALPLSFSSFDANEFRARKLSSVPLGRAGRFIDAQIYPRHPRCGILSHARDSIVFNLLGRSGSRLVCRSVKHLLFRHLVVKSKLDRCTHPDAMNSADHVALELSIKTKEFDRSIPYKI